MFMKPSMLWQHNLYMCGIVFKHWPDTPE